MFSTVHPGFAMQSVCKRAQMLTYGLDKHIMTWITTTKLLLCRFLLNQPVSSTNCSRLGQFPKGLPKWNLWGCWFEVFYTPDGCPFCHPTDSVKAVNEYGTDCWVIASSLAAGFHETFAFDLPCSLAS